MYALNKERKTQLPAGNYNDDIRTGARARIKKRKIYPAHSVCRGANGTRSVPDTFISRQFVRRLGVARQAIASYFWARMKLKPEFPKADSSRENSKRPSVFRAKMAAFNGHFLCNAGDCACRRSGGAAEEIGLKGPFIRRVRTNQSSLDAPTRRLSTRCTRAQVR